MVTLDFSIDKREPHRYPISQDDLQYLDEKILHSRSALSAASHPASICGSRIMEAARTALVVGKILLNDVTFSHAHITVDEEKKTAECQYEVDSYIARIPNKRHVQCSSDKCLIVIKYVDACCEVPAEGTYSIAIYSKLHSEPYAKVFTLNCQKMMTYDMNFPPPSELVEWVICCIDEMHHKS